MLSQCCLLVAFSLPASFSENIWCVSLFFFALLYSKLLPPLSSLSCERKPRGSLFTFSPLIVFHLSPDDIELSPPSIQLSARELEKTHG